MNYLVLPCIELSLTPVADDAEVQRHDWRHVRWRGYAVVCILQSKSNVTSKDCKNTFNASF